MSTAALTHKLLIIDDHPETLDIIKRVLRQQGYLVLATQSAINGLSLTESETPDLILVDGMMPEMDGWEFCRRVRANPHISNTHIIMFSAVSAAEQKLAGFDAGADDYLTKPTEPSELVERVRTMLENIVPRNDIRLAPSSDAFKPGPSGTAPYSSQRPPQSATADLEKAPPQRLTIVLGVRGGCGATLTAINMAVSMADNGLPTTLIDLDTTQGHIAQYLHQKQFRSLNELCYLPDALVPLDLLSYLVAYQDNLNLLLSETDLLHKKETVTPTHAQTIVETLQENGRYTLIDGGHTITPTLQALLPQAEHIFICLRPERVALFAAKQMLTHLSELIYPTSQTHLLMCDYGGCVVLPKTAVEGYLGRNITAVLTASAAEINQSVNKNIPLVQLTPTSKMTLLLKRIVQTLTAV
jgi:DNA-binding response OmpR family regulator/MinD-like ATPase involved in chromosome partitioning or flagellar assembly